MNVQAGAVIMPLGMFCFTQKVLECYIEEVISLVCIIRVSYSGGRGISPPGSVPPPPYHFREV